tara:strand:- start:836 stop:1147 length:312 start_codon:yes stop_codon:yes gene_type:complete
VKPARPQSAYVTNGPPRNIKNLTKARNEMEAVHENGILKKKLQSMTVLGNEGEETNDGSLPEQVDKAQCVTNWISDEVAKFDGRQEEVLQHLNEISVRRKLES